MGRVKGGVFLALNLSGECGDPLGKGGIHMGPGAAGGSRVGKIRGEQQPPILGGTHSPRVWPGLGVPEEFWGPGGVLGSPRSFGAPGRGVGVAQGVAR